VICGDQVLDWPRDEETGNETQADHSEKAETDGKET
jgi:hypothetical protein